MLSFSLGLVASLRRAPGTASGPRLHIAAEAMPAAAPRPSGRALSKGFLRAFGGAQSAAALIAEVEKDPLFEILVAAGAVRRVALRGAIPRSRREMWRLEEAVTWVRDRGLDQRADWPDFLNRRSLPAAVLADAARRWGVEEKELGEAIKSLRGEGETLLRPVNDAAEGASDRGGRVEQSELPPDALTVCWRFVRRYGLTEQDFADYLLTGERNPAQLSSRFGCSLREAHETFEAVRALDLADLSRRDAGTQEQYGAEDAVAAMVQIGPDGELEVRIVLDERCPRYGVSLARVDALRRAGSLGGDKERPLEPLLEKIRAVNERTGVLHRLVVILCQRQAEFLRSGDAAARIPLSQAQVARDLGVHPSVVSRLLRGLLLRTPHGERPLAALAPPTGHIVAALLARNPDWDDAAIARHWRARYGRVLSRRAVNYHRNHLPRREE